MAVKIRLMRVGKTKQPVYRVVAADARSPRDGRFIEILGQYNPRQTPSLINIDNHKAVKWLRTGAQPTERAMKLLKISGAWDAYKAGILPEPAPKVIVQQTARPVVEAPKPAPVAAPVVEEAAPVVAEAEAVVAETESVVAETSSEASETVTTTVTVTTVVDGEVVDETKSVTTEVAE